MDAIIVITYAFAFCFFYKNIRSSPITGLWFWMVFLVIYEVIYYSPGISIGVNLELQDVVIVGFSIISLQRFHKLSYFLKYDSQLRWWVFSLVYFVFAVPLFSLFKGHNIISSINLAREFLLFVPAFIYFCSFRYMQRDINAIYKVLLNVALVTGLVVFPFQLFSVERIVPASAAFFYACTAILIVTRFYNGGKTKDLYLSLFLIVLVILLRHRSVWITLFLGLVFVQYYYKVNKKIVAILLVACVSTIALAIVVPEKFSRVLSMVEDTASPFESADNFENSTGGGRIARWTAQIESKFEWSVLVWGLGHAYDRKVYFKINSKKKRLNTVSFHNYYLEQMFRVGGVSVLVLLMFFFKYLKLNHKKQKLYKNYALVGLSACLFGTIGFGMMYTYNYLAFILIGIGYSILIRKDEMYYSNPHLQPVQQPKSITLDSKKLAHSKL